MIHPDYTRRKRIEMKQYLRNQLASYAMAMSVVDNFVKVPCDVKDGAGRIEFHWCNLGLHLEVDNGRISAWGDGDEVTFTEPLELIEDFNRALENLPPCDPMKCQGFYYHNSWASLSVGY